jgi:phenylacetic acid degradation protein
MALYEFEGRRPVIGENSYVSETADVIGDVRIGAGCYIGPGARIKGDYGTITIGDETSVQENCVIHARPGERCDVGSRCTIGHGSVLHNCTVRDGAVVGMGAIVSDWADVGEEALVAEGAVVRQNDQIPPATVAMSVPAKVKAKLTERDRAFQRRAQKVYPDLALRYLKGLKKL